MVSGWARAASECRGHMRHVYVSSTPHQPLSPCIVPRRARPLPHFAPLALLAAAPHSQLVLVRLLHRAPAVPPQHQALGPRPPAPRVGQGPVDVRAGQVRLVRAQPHGHVAPHTVVQQATGGAAGAHRLTGAAPQVGPHHLGQLEEPVRGVLLHVGLGVGVGVIGGRAGA